MVLHRLSVMRVKLTFFYLLIWLYILYLFLRPNYKSWKVCWSPKWKTFLSHFHSEFWIFKMPMARLCRDMIKSVFLSSRSLFKNVCGRGFSFSVSKGALWESYPCLLVLPWECPFLYLQRDTVFQCGRAERKWALHLGNNVSASGLNSLLAVSL